MGLVFIQQIIRPQATYFSLSTFMEGERSGSPAKNGEANSRQVESFAVDASTRPVKDRTVHHIPRNLSTSEWGQSPDIIERRGVLAVASINSVHDLIIIISLIANSATFLVNDSQVNRTNPADSGGRGELPALIG